MTTTAAPPTPERIFGAINAYQQTEALKTALELEIFTAIQEGNTTAVTIAKRCAASERGVRDTLRFSNHSWLFDQDRKGVCTDTGFGFLPQPQFACICRWDD